MHDLDRTDDRPYLESESFFDSASEAERESFEFQSEQRGAFDEAEVSELAAELLGVVSDREFNDFLSGLMKKAGRAVGHTVTSTIGQPLGSALKSAAKAALPVAGSMIGNVLAPGVGGAIGGAIGSRLASAASSKFGLEAEGMTLEDRQYEAAKQFVRFGGDATQKALAMTRQGHPAPAAAKAAVKQAAERFVPGLVGAPRPPAAGPARAQLPTKGTWARHGNRIILHIRGE